MKKLIIVALALASLTTYAQKVDGGKRHHKREFAQNLTAEEVATLQTKKMTLALGLDDGQAKKVFPILLKQATERKEAREAREAASTNTKNSKGSRYERANERLDKRIAMQNQMKSILTEAQFEKFQKTIARRSKRAQGKRGGERGHRSRG